MTIVLIKVPVASVCLAIMWLMIPVLLVHKAVRLVIAMTFVGVVLLASMLSWMEGLLPGIVTLVRVRVILVRLWDKHALPVRQGSI